MTHCEITSMKVIVTLTATLTIKQFENLGKELE